MTKFCYADPPYVGQAKKHYSHDPRCAEVDHTTLLAHLSEYDGWALSLSSPSLQQILALCPAGVRVGAWVKPFAAFKKNVPVVYAWEPVIFSPIRRRPTEIPSVRDYVREPITMKKGLVGTKPHNFNLWLFQVLGAEPGDDFVDLYPGTGGVTDSWKFYQDNYDKVVREMFLG